MNYKEWKKGIAGENKGGNDKVNPSGNYRAWKQNIQNNFSVTENLKQELNKKIMSQSSPFSQGTLMPSGMQSAAVKKLKDTQTAEKLKTTIPSVSYDALEIEVKNLEEKKIKLHSEMETARKNWEDWKKSDGSALSKVFDYIGNQGVNDLRREYENKKVEYENFEETLVSKKQELAEKRIQQNYGVTGAEYINQLKEKKKEAQTDAQKEFYKDKIKNVRQELYGKSNVFQHIGNIANEGILTVNKGVMATLDFLLGTPAKWLGFENNFFTQLNNDATQRLQNASNETYESAQYLGDTGNYSGQLGTALIAAVPDLLITIYTGGASKGVQLGSAAINAANPTFINRITTDIVNTAKSPIFYSSFVQQLGVNYEENLESGKANELEAALAALFASSVTARMEMGGFQSLGDELAETKSFWKKAYKWFLSSLEEGVEEPGQTSATNAINKLIYDHDKKLISTADEDAVFNPVRASEKFGVGTFVGAVLGGGQLTFSGIINAKENSQYKQIGKAVIKTTNIQEIIDYAKSSPNDTVRLIAREVNANSISDADAGRLYQYAVTNINEKFDDVYTVEDLNNVVSEYFLRDIPQAVKNIASASFANKLVEMNIEPETNEVYNSLTNHSEADLQSTTNAVSQPLETYNNEKQNLIKSFLNSADEKIKSFVERVKSGDLTFKREKISNVNERTVKDIKSLLGIDTTGYTHNINTNGIQHILIRHGENGEHDNTMSLDDDIARVGWVLENYDSVEILEKDGEISYSSEFRDSEDNPAPQIKFIKKIDGSYYVVEAVCENNYNKLWVQSAYLTKNKEDVTQAAFADNDQDTNAQSALASPSSNNNIPQGENVVNTNIRANSETYSLQGDSDNGIIKNNQETGDEVNAGRQNGDDNQRLGREIFSSEEQAGTVQENLGRNYDQSRTEGIQQRGSSEVRNQGNNRRIELTPEQKESLKTTAIKDESGNPKEVSHFTDNMDFETFSKGDIGFHFGNEQQAVERGKNLKKTGRIIKAHLDIKNPLKISTDLMTWSPIHIAFKLSVEEIITKEDFAKIRKLTEQGGRDYNSPAAVELRKILADKGYDGIAYENMFEAEGESYIAFYPEQVIIINDGKINNEADTEVPANFMPENADNSNSSESGEYGLSNPTDQEIHREPTAEEYNEAMFGKMKNAKQRHILDVAEKLDSGMKVVFVSENARVLSGQDAVYMHDSNTIYLSEANSAVKCYYQLFKHEFIHRLESKGMYQSFKKYLFRNSSSFERYARARLGEGFKGTREEALQALAQEYIDTVQNGTFSQDFKKNFTEEDAQREMVADFISEVLFKGNRKDVAQHLSDSNLEAIYKVEDTLTEFENLTETDRNWFQKFIDWIRDLIASLKGVNQNKRLVEDLEYIEKRLGRVYDSWDTKKAAKNSAGVLYHLNPYSEHQVQNWKNSKNIVVYKDDHQLRKFIIDAQKGVNLNKKMYFGAISQELADRIKRDTGLDVNRYNCTLRASEIRKILNDHGNEEKESLRGQRAITEDDFVLIPQIIQSPDKIVLSDELFEGKPVIHFVKTINGKTTIAAYVSAKHLDLTVQTMYSGKNKGNLSIVAGEQAPANTPEANAGTVSNNSVPHEKDTVNSNSMQETQEYSEPVSKGKRSFSLSSPAQQMRDNLKRYESREITREEYLEKTDELWGEANETYGMLPQGENAKAPIATPQAIDENSPTERFTRTIIETGKLTEEMLQGMEEKVLLGNFSYEEISDEKAMGKADTAINNGTAEDTWENVVHGDKANKNQIAIGERLLKDAIESGNTKRVLELSSELADIFTRAGQVVQAARILKKMTGAGRLVSAQRAVKTLNRDMQQKYGEDFSPIKISPEAATRLANAKTESGIEHAYEEVMYEVASQMPVTFMDKWNAWRYFAMLCNPKTHIRNLVGNAIFIPATRIRYFLAAVGEQAVSQEKRTKSVIVKKEFRDFAKKDAQSKQVVDLLKGNKYNDKSALREKQRIFKSNALEFLTRFNSKALEAEDMLFKNKHYIHALAGFLQARDVDLKNVSQEIMDEARIYAVAEAKKATFNDESALADLLQNKRTKTHPGLNFAIDLAVESTLPFKRTPINIVKRGVEYSPIGLSKTLTKGLYDVKKGKITLTEFIDGLASGLTGTGIMLAGMFLANLGLISGGEEDEDKSQFEKWLGKKEYAIEILGHSYTIEWAVPASIPFFIGAEIVNTINSGEDFQLSQLGNIVWNSLEPITNLSMLSGIQGVIEAARFADSAQTLSAIATSAITSYAMQGIPSLAGAVSRTIDPTQRSWYIDKNDKWLDSTAQTIKNNIQSKVPGLSYTQIPKIDMWGREVSRGGTTERVLENFVSPGEYSKIEVTETSEELKRIFNKTDIDVFPNLAEKSFDIDGKKKYLTASEYVTYAKAKGSYSLDYVEEFMHSAAYEHLTDEERADVIDGLYNFSNAKAKTTVSDYDLTKQFKTVTNWERNGRSAVDYYIYKAINK